MPTPTYDTRYESSVQIKPGAPAPPAMITPVGIPALTSKTSSSIDTPVYTITQSPTDPELYFKFNQSPTAHLTGLYNPFLKKVTYLNYEYGPEKDIHSYKCRVDSILAPGSMDNPCDRVTASFNPKTGALSLNFSDQYLSIGAGKPIHPMSITLNGRLTGSLATPPASIASLSKTSTGQITINGQPRTIQAAVYGLDAATTDSYKLSLSSLTSPSSQSARPRDLTPNMVTMSPTDSSAKLTNVAFD